MALKRTVWVPLGVCKTFATLAPQEHRHIITQTRDLRSTWKSPQISNKSIFMPFCFSTCTEAACPIAMQWTEGHREGSVFTG